MSGPTRTLRVFAAGSLRNVLAKLVDASSIDTSLEPTFGPAGLLRERIEGGDVPDLFLSANTDHPAALARDRPGLRVRPFARNALVAIARPSLHLMTGTFLDGLLTDGARIGTSGRRTRRSARPSGRQPGARTLGGRARGRVPLLRHERSPRSRTRSMSSRRPTSWPSLRHTAWSRSHPAAKGWQPPSRMPRRAAPCWTRLAFSALGGCGLSTGSLKVRYI